MLFFSFYFLFEYYFKIPFSFLFHSKWTPTFATRFFTLLFTFLGFFHFSFLCTRFFLSIENEFYYTFKRKMPLPASELLSSWMLQIITKTTTFKRYKMELKWICDKENTFFFSKKRPSIENAAVKKSIRKPNIKNNMIKETRRQKCVAMVMMQRCNFFIQTLTHRFHPAPTLLQMILFSLVFELKCYSGFSLWIIVEIFGIFGLLVFFNLDGWLFI